MVEVNGVKGYYIQEYGIKPTAEPLSATKSVYLDSDWEWREVFVPATEEEIAFMEQQEVSRTIPSRVDTLEATTDEVVLFLADAIGGSAND